MVKEMNGDLKSVSKESILELCNGFKVKNIIELHSAVGKMANKDFSHHINGEKNDFYLWAKDVLKDKELADDLFECSTKEAIKFCLSCKIDSENIAAKADGPKEYDRENDKFIELPRGYHPKFGAKDISGCENKLDIGRNLTGGSLVTLINLNEIKNNTLGLNRNIKNPKLLFSHSEVISNLDSGVFTKTGKEKINNI